MFDFIKNNKKVLVIAGGVLVVFILIKGGVSARNEKIKQEEADKLTEQLLAEANEKAAKALEQKRQAEAARAAATSGQTTTKTKVTSIPTSANNDSSVASNIVSIAYRYVGVPYRSGGASPSGFDCSGLVSYVLAQAGISGVARSSSSQAYGGVAVSGGISAAQPGDVICYPGHVGIYIGGGQMIHASVPGDYVKVSSVNIGMQIIGVRRYW